MRVTKKPDERRNEILDVTENLFITKGYAATTIQDIIMEIGIAKGTFYYYFSSKESVMDAVVMRFIERTIADATLIVEDDQLTAPEKLFHIIINQVPQTPEKDHMIEELHQVDNAEIHQKSLVESIIQLTPVFTRVIEQGIEEGYFQTPYPKETVEFLLVASQFLFDEGIFSWGQEELQKKALAFTYMMENMLQAEKGSFTYIFNQLSNLKDDNKGREKNDESKGTCR
ncbi:MAG TPA: TetR/AcrR family transcriptional regulator [Bacillota bacterium]|nr:TetR/AcrR family transcriptional regulator [Bacillota bacterium]